MMNNVCRNFKFNEKADGVLELISLNCDNCDIDSEKCGIKIAYEQAKVYSCSIELNENRGYR